MLFEGNSWEQKLEFPCPRANIHLDPCFYLDEFSHSFQPEKYGFNQSFLGVKFHQNEKKKERNILHHLFLFFLKIIPNFNKIIKSPHLDSDFSLVAIWTGS